MAPIKFEENIKDKLEKRTLSPSSEGWSKLADRLDADEKKSKSPIFWWLSIAAGIIIMIAVSASFFKPSNTENTLPKMVIEDEKLEQLEDKSTKLNDTKSIELASEDEVDESKNESSNSIKIPQIIEYRKVTLKKQSTKEQLANSKLENSKTLEENKSEDLNINSQEINETSIRQDAMADVLNDLKTKNSSVTDREIDSLLKVASKELFKDKLQKEISKTVDANLLLQDVEEEMGESFRSKVFNALKDSYKTVKTKVAERNN